MEPVGKLAACSHLFLQVHSGSIVVIISQPPPHAHYQMSPTMNLLIHNSIVYECMYIISAGADPGGGGGGHGRKLPPP